MTFFDYNVSGNAVPSIDYLDNLDADQSFANSVSQPSTISSVIVNDTLPVHPRPSHLMKTFIIPLYATIFLLSMVGNSSVLITLACNKRMRTVTNVYLLNLAVADLLLGIFCMPFTLLGQILKNFIFGLLLCKLISYFQVVSVSVAVWTLVAISLERYFAICKPLKSRRWQTEFHAYKMITIVWTVSLTWGMPMLIVSQLQSLRGGRHRCREEWPTVGTELAFNLFLDGTLLLIPLIIMSVAYWLIAAELWRGLRQEIRQTSTCQRRLESTESSGTVRNSSYDRGDGGPSTMVVLNDCSASSRLSRGFKLCIPRSRISKIPNSKCQGPEYPLEPRTQNRINGNSHLTRGTTNTINEEQEGASYPFSGQPPIRSNYIGKSIEAKKKVIRMLFVIVLEFFICWAPLHVINTWHFFTPELVFSVVGSTGISLVQLLAYVSSCCNPITYCFMNRKFRQAFLDLFNCHRCWRIGCRNDDVAMTSTRNAIQVGNDSELSENESTIFLEEISLVPKSGNTL